MINYTREWDWMDKLKPYKKNMTHEQLHEWAKENLLPHEDTATRLRFAEGNEGYDLDYIKERHNERKHD